METKLTCIKCGKRVDYLCCELCTECSLCSIAKELRQQRDDLLAACEKIYECGSIKEAEQIAEAAVKKAR